MSLSTSHEIIKVFPLFSEGQQYSSYSVALLLSSLPQLFDFRTHSGTKLKKISKSCGSFSYLCVKVLPLTNKRPKLSLCKRMGVCQEWPL